MDIEKYPNIFYGGKIMKTKFNLRKTSLFEKNQQLIEKKLTRLDKFFSDSAEAMVTVNKVKDSVAVEVVISDKGMMFRAERSGKSVTGCVDEIIDILTRQIRKNKTRLEKKLYQGVPVYIDSEYVDQEDYNVIKTKKISLTPMDVEDAILEMNMLGHSFFLFKDIATQKICVVYKRLDGDYGVLEAE